MRRTLLPLLAAAPLLGAETRWIVPSSAHAPGAGGAFYTTDLLLANPGGSAATVTVRFLGHDADGRTGPARAVTVPPGATTTLPDVLATLFDVASGYGALEVGTAEPGLLVSSLTTTPAPGGGTFGQSVPAMSDADLVRAGTPRSIPGVRQDARFRTNLILANAGDEALDVTVTLLDAQASELGRKTYALPPRGMTQVTRVVRDMGVTADVSAARLLLGTSSPSGAFAAYASVVDAGTNDPRTLLPRFEAESGTRILPSVARAAGAGGAFFTTDLAVANPSRRDATYTLRFLGHEVDGRQGPVRSFTIAAGETVTHRDVLLSVFGVESGYGALAIDSTSTALTAVSQTSTPGADGTASFGQSVPSTSPGELIPSGDARSILGVTEDARYRTNLVLANASDLAVEVDVALVDADGTPLGAGRFAVPPLGMRQLARVARELGVTRDVTGARLVVSAPTPGARLAAYASAIDETTNDPRSLLPVAPPPDGFRIELPVAVGDEAFEAFGVLPYGIHVSGHVLDGGHPGWDLELAPGASVRAAAAGTVTFAAVNEPATGRWAVQLDHVVGTRRFRTDYLNLASVAPGVVSGATVVEGQALGIAGTQEVQIGSTRVSYRMTHFQVDDLLAPDPGTGISNHFARSPEAYLSPAARSRFHTIWARAAYNQELTESLPTQPRLRSGAPYPIRRVWSLQGGPAAAGEPAALELAAEDPAAFPPDRVPSNVVTRYTLLDAKGAVTETGWVQLSTRAGAAATVDLLEVDEAGVPTGAKRLGRYDVVSDVLVLALGPPGAPRPADLSAARVYATGP